jgi:hypothetical protein
MNKFKFLAVLLILVFNQFSVVAGRFIHYPAEDDSLKLIEKVYLHIDRENYLAGDDIWFKAYLIDALDHLLTDHSSNLHVELISPSSEIISGRIIRLEGGLGNGDFKLPADIRSGRYRLRAYTNYMRNFSDQLFFTKEITIVNPKGEEAENPGKVKYVENKIQINFFPEGGSMLDNVASIVAFKAVDYLGNGCDVSGKIYSSNGDLITNFKSGHKGMGTFLLRPLPGLKYYCKVKGADSIDVTYNLPASFQKGISLSTSFNKDNELIITTRTNSESFASFAEQDLFLVISIRKEIINTIPFRIKSPVTSFVLPTGYLPDGIISLTLSTRENVPFSERLVYLEKETPLNIIIATDKLTYKKREPVNLKISLSGDSAIEKTANISLAAIDETFTNNTSLYTRNISSWFLLESDIRGKVEDPSYYFDPSNKERLRDLDLLLRTQGWRDFYWKYDTTYFPPEKGFGVSGRLKNFNKNKTTEGSRISVGIFGSKSTFFTTLPVDSTGRFNLSGIDLTGEARLIVSGIDQKERMNGLLILDSLKYNPAEVSDSLSFVSMLTESKNTELKSYYIVSKEILKKYKLSDTIRIGEVNIISKRHKDPQTIKIEQSRSKYLKPESEVIVTEQMVGYGNMLQLLKGKVPGLLVLGGVFGDTAIVIRGLGSINNNRNPLILIDGNRALFRDLSDMPVFLVDRIDVLKSVGSTVIYGLEASGGVINIITKAGGVPTSYNLPQYSAKHRISGYDAPRIFYSPQHLSDSGTDYNPDLRKTLLWNPDVTLDGTNEVILNYYNGDNSSLIRIIAEGITTTGVPITGKAEYEVK